VGCDEAGMVRSARPKGENARYGEKKMNPGVFTHSPGAGKRGGFALYLAGLARPADGRYGDRRTQA